MIGSTHHGSAWDATNQRSNVVYNSSNMNHSIGPDKTSADYSNDNTMNSVQRTLQLNIPIRRTLPSQLNMPNNDNSNTSNMNLSQISRKVRMACYTSFLEYKENYFVIYVNDKILFSYRIIRLGIMHLSCPPIEHQILITLLHLLLGLKTTSFT